MYVGMTPKISQPLISKVEGSNEALFTFEILPKLEISAMPNFIESLNFSFNANFTLLSCSIEESKINLQIKYSQDL